MFEISVVTFSSELLLQETNKLHWSWEKEAPFFLLHCADSSTRSEVLMNWYFDYSTDSKSFRNLLVSAS